jgi:hypothetical protein
MEVFCTQVGFEILTVAAMKSSIFRNVICSKPNDVLEECVTCICRVDE